MRKVVFILGILCGLVWAQPKALIAEGRFQEAYAQALEANTAKSLALAAQAASFQAIYLAENDAEREMWFSRAEQAARRAIELDPNYAEGYFELGRALGRLAQYRGILQSLFLASEVRNVLNKTLELDPQHAGARTALALWNLELAQRGVGFLYGARMDRVIPLFEEAIALEPEVIIHRVEYAEALSRMNRTEQARAQLEAALSLPAQSARDRFDQERARRMLAELE
ncbi:tetratricopeptide repeat protein [Marinithermus hydrothermalis]|uniref:Tetratricopeptide TPR_1 repeat-containing protein n=1 Tax=Marinithermus hydrothermalis (strain DSM 14884 / JCM 11576 / T1) TaxID=869210 RepID=F2NKT9_MARHT|nr:tetratricopeptide repeat protein [Marinithermus hydrothermalis]AEB10852.1 hypothetical protein Marky_0089 [Marinithermus hydrothermalis DSM 14884]